jgi:hypothetical protein
MNGKSRVLVCDQCLRASCWYGEFMCDASKDAGLMVATVDDLRKFAREHESYWSDETMMRQYGTTDRKFRV